MMAAAASADDVREDFPQLLKALREKDDSAQALQQALDAERRRRREDWAARAALEESFAKVEADLRKQLDLRQQNDLREQVEDKQAEILRLESQIEGYRAREADLLGRSEAVTADARGMLSRAEVDAAELFASRAKVDALQAEVADAQDLLRTSDQIREGLLREATLRQHELEHARKELRELHGVERAGRETAAAQYDRLNAQCESLTRQLQERQREADVLDERCKRLDEALRVKTVESERALEDADARRKSTESKVDKALEDGSALKEELRANAVVETKLRERIAGLEAEENRLRQELFRAQSLADERELLAQTGRRREQHLSEQVKEMEGRLEGAQAEAAAQQKALYSSRAQVQTLELELQSAREGASAARSQASRSKEFDLEEQQSLLRKKQDKISQQAEEISALEAEVKRLREELRGAQEAAHKKEGEIGLTRGELERATQELQRRDEHLRLKDDEVQRKTQEIQRRSDEIQQHEDDLRRTRTDLRRVQEDRDATMDRLKATLDEANLRRLELGSEMERLKEELGEVRAAADAEAERRRRITFAERSTSTSPRLMGVVPAEQRFAELRESIGSLHDTLRAGLVAVSPTGGADATMFEGEVTPNPLSAQQAAQAEHFERFWRSLLHYSERRIVAMNRRATLKEAWQTWAFRLREAELGARLAQADAAESLSEANLGTLKRLILECRHRLSAALLDLLPADLGEARVTVTFALDKARRMYGRLLHAMLFLYQKLRTIVPTELKEAVEHPMAAELPLPFYVLPYKADAALRFGVQALLRQEPAAEQDLRRFPPFPEDCLHPGDPNLVRWLSEHVSELEDAFPLRAGDVTDVPFFLARLLRVRAQAIRAVDQDFVGEVSQVQAMVHDRLDVLLADALTMYMSSWRMAPPSPPVPPAKRAGTQPRRPRCAHAGGRSRGAPFRCSSCELRARPELCCARDYGLRPELRLGPLERLPA